MDDLQNALRERFPLLTSMRILHDSGDSEGLASFMGILLAAMHGAHGSSFCFVLPRKQGLATLSASLYALGRFAIDFPDLAERYAKRSFSNKQRVRLIPEDEVFEFAGIWPDLDKWFRLRLLDDKRNTSFNWPISDILRIAPTTRKLPKGREADISKARMEAPLSTLDKLTGTKTFGNLSLAINYVLLLGGKAETEEFLVSTSLTGPLNGIHSTLDDLITPGFITESGEIRHRDNYQAAGEPLMAISSRLENVAAACKTAVPGSKTVIVDGARRITELAQFDAIAESQNLIILAEPDEEEKLQQLHDRGCRFWRFSLSDLELGESEQQGRRFFHSAFRSARNEAAFRIDVLSCRNYYLEEVARSLDLCQGSLNESDGDETQLILSQVYSLLVQCSGLLTPPTPEERGRLLERTAKLSLAARNRNMWLPEMVAKALIDACTAITFAIEDPELGLAKGSALRGLLINTRREESSSFAVVARSLPNSQSVSRWLEQEGEDCTVVLPSNLADGVFFEKLICPAWPGSGKFGRIVCKFSAPQICLIAYPFESQWLAWFKRKQHASQKAPCISSEEKSRLLGISSEVTWADRTQSPMFPAVLPDINGHSYLDLEQRMSLRGVMPIGAGEEERVQATHVGFSGDAYAFLTDNFRIPVISDLISGTAGANSKVPRRTLSEIQARDVLIFRESGRRDVIQSLADAELGPEGPAIRERAARWHKALRESGLDESMLMSELQKFNCPRTLQTVRGWLADDSMIGPQTKDDLEAIAYAVGDQQLLDDVSLIWDAVHLLRGEHLSAGMRLSQILMERLPERLGDIKEGRTRIDIDNATSAWIVQIESISDHSEMRPRSHINSLLWDSDDLF
jgi:hypothetical protein